MRGSKPRTPLIRAIPSIRCESRCNPKENYGYFVPRELQEEFDTCKSISFDIFEICMAEVLISLTQESKNRTTGSMLLQALPASPEIKKAPGETYNKVFDSKSTFEFQSEFSNCNSFTKGTNYERQERKCKQSFFASTYSYYR